MTSPRVLDRAENGSVSLLIVILAGALLAFAGLVTDGSAGLAAGARASDLAQGAARAGVQAAATPDTQGAVSIDIDQAVVAADHWLSAQGLMPEQATVTADATGVRVIVNLTQPTTLLRLAGIRELHVSRTGAARPAIGITKEAG